MKVERDGIGNRVRQLRKRLDLSQIEFAMELGTTNENISRIESGFGNILKRICEKYQVNEEWLKNGSGEMFKTSESGQAARKAGDLISRSALMREMAGIVLNTEEDVRAWIEAEQLVEKAPAVTTGAKRFVRCDRCQFLAQSQEGDFWCRNLGGLGGELHPEEGDGCCRGKRPDPDDSEEEDMQGWISEAIAKAKGVPDDKNE